MALVLSLHLQYYLAAAAAVAAFVHGHAIELRRLSLSNDNKAYTIESRCINSRLSWNKHKSVAFN